MGRGGEGGGGRGVEERGNGCGEKKKKKKQRSNTKSMAANFKGGFLCREKKPEQNHILLDTRGQKLAFRFFKLGKRDGKRKKKLFRCDFGVVLFVYEIHFPRKFIVRFF
jgi:hypothetical protein